MLIRKELKILPYYFSNADNAYFLIVYIRIYSVVGKFGDSTKAFELSFRPKGITENMHRFLENKMYKNTTRKIAFFFCQNKTESKSVHGYIIKLVLKYAHKIKGSKRYFFFLFH